MVPTIHSAGSTAVLASAWATLGWVLLWIGVGLATLLALFALLPVHLRAAGSVDDLRLAGQVRVRWAWGVISVRLRPDRGATLHLLGLRIWTFRRRDDAEPADEKPPRKRARGWLPWLAEHRHTGLRIGRRLVRTLRLQLALAGELGLGDPAATALLTRLLGELNRTSAAVRLQVEPNWLDERVQLDGEIRARIWLAHLGWVLAGALLRRETRQMIRTVPRAAR
jgi:hypothetical protein